MNKHSDDPDDWDSQRTKIIGLGESSIRKSYFPELQKRHNELIRKNEELHAAYEQLAATNEELRANYDSLARTEQNLRESEQRFREVLGTSSVALFKFDFCRNRFEYISPAITDITGFTPPEILAMSKQEFDAMVHPDDLRLLRQSFEESVCRGGGQYQGEFRLTHRDGKILWVSETGHVFVGASGASYSIGSMQDISDKKYAEFTLRENEELYRTLIETTETGFVIVDREGLVLDANPRYVRLSGHRDLKEILGRSVLEWTAGYEQERNQRAIRECLDRGYIRSFEVDYQDKSGRITPIELNATVLPIGGSIRILSLCREITERRRAEKTLQQSRKKLNLLNTVTFQDIQSAVFSLSAYQELLRNVIRDEKNFAYFEKEMSLVQKIAQSLKFARDYQDLGMNAPRWQNVNQTFLFAISHLDFLDIEREVTIGNLEIYADPLLEKVFLSLMENVLAHGIHANRVSITYRKKPDSLIILVEDNGTGISPEEKNMIFDRGYGKNGGLGLFLVREILSITDITIRETGIYGQGARFEISVPQGAYRFPLPDKTSPG